MYIVDVVPIYRQRHQHRRKLRHKSGGGSWRALCANL